ncbi:MAG TPA: RibD family protein [Rubrobacteraceae bacterium]|nr:RibD family protein [Rubrobacteraceae bacterium]
MLINMVASLDGKASVGGKASAIGSHTDRTLMRSLRARADAVMIGAGTLRAEKLRLDVPEDLAKARASRGLEPQPLAVLVTTRGDVPLGANLVDTSLENVLIVASPEIPQERLASLSSHVSVEIVTKEMATPADTGLDLGRALEVLKGRYGVGVLLVEGGPALNHSLISSGLADELFLTLAPKVLGGEAPESLTVVEGSLLRPRDMAPKVVSVHLFDDELFLRYALCSEEDAIC